MATWSTKYPLNISPLGTNRQQGFEKHVSEFNEVYSYLNMLRNAQAGTTAPVSPEANELWLNTSGAPPTLNYWDGEAWQGVSTPSLPNRNTVLQGKVDASGNPALFEAGTGLAVKLNATATTAVFGFMNGNSASQGAVDIVAAVNADSATFWSSLPTTSTVFLYVDYTTSTVSGGFTTVAPVYQTYAPDHAAGLHWLDFNTGKVWLSDGSAWTQRNRVFVGTATTDGSGVTAVDVYAYNVTQEIKANDIIAKGPWVDVRAFGAVGDGVTDDTAAIQAAITYSAGGKVLFPSGRYLMNVVVTVPFNIEGNGSHSTFFQAADASRPIFVNKYVDNAWQYSKIKGVYFDGVGVSTPEGYRPVAGSVGFSFGDPDAYIAGDELVGRVIFTDCRFVYLDKGLFRCWGNIGNVYNDCVFSLNNYGYYSRDPRLVDVTYGLMNAGCELFNGGEFDHNNIAGLCALDGASAGQGQWTFTNTVVQFNIGFGLYFSFMVGNVYPVLLNNVWNEGNGGAAVTIDAVDIDNGGIKQVSLTAESFSMKTGNSNSYNYISFCDSHMNYGNKQNYASSTVYADSRPNFAAARARTDPASYVFVTTGDEQNPDAQMVGLLNGEVYFVCGETGRPVGLYPNGTMGVGYHGQAGGQPSEHVVGGAGTSAVTEGNAIIRFQGAYNSSFPTRIYEGAGGEANAAATVVKISSNYSTGRSVNCHGTLNVGGLDYAEYMRKAESCGEIPKGAICGINADGLLTDKFSEAVTFVVKSTNPSYVGGDDWHFALGEPPRYPALVDYKKESDYEKALAKYKLDIEDYQQRLEAERIHVDRISFCGQVPVNVLGATPGQYIIPVANGDGIKGIAVSNPTFEQYQSSIGVTIAVEADGRARIIVKVV